MTASLAEAWEEGWMACQEVHSLSENPYTTDPPAPEPTLPFPGEFELPDPGRREDRGKAVPPWRGVWARRRENDAHRHGPAPSPAVDGPKEDA